MRTRSALLVAGAVALISAQSAYAAPAAASSQQLTDPLVALSALGTPQSRAAVATLGSTATVQGAPPALTGPPPGLPANQYPRPNAYLPGAWPFVIGFFALATILAFAAAHHDDDEPTPISPD